MERTVQASSRSWSAVTEPVPDSLRTWNLIVGLVMAVQAVAVALLSNDFDLPVTGSFLSGPPGSTFTEPEVLYRIPVGFGVTIFLALAAIDHLLMAAPGIWPWYRDNLNKKINYARWMEYSASASLMIVLISMVCGVSDIGALIAIFGVNAAMIFFGLSMELQNQNRQEVNWWNFIAGSIVGIVPWIIVVIQLVGAEERATGQGVPTFVYGIVISYFILFNSFAINMALQYAQVGKWKSYVFGEKAYMVLSLTAKTLLAWLIFANTLVD